MMSFLRRKLPSSNAEGTKTRSISGGDWDKNNYLGNSELRSSDRLDGNPGGRLEFGGDYNLDFLDKESGTGIRSVSSREWDQDKDA